MTRGLCRVITCWPRTYRHRCHSARAQFKTLVYMCVQVTANKNEGRRRHVHHQHPFCNDSCWTTHIFLLPHTRRWEEVAHQTSGDAVDILGSWSSQTSALLPPHIRFGVFSTKARYQQYHSSPYKEYLDLQKLTIVTRKQSGMFSPREQNRTTDQDTS